MPAKQSFFKQPFFTLCGMIFLCGLITAVIAWLIGGKLANMIKTKSSLAIN